MKPTIQLVVLLATISAPAIGARAQSYAITSFAIAGGGGASSGGTYTLSGTIGQSDVGALAGGSYQLVGGFWNDIITVPIIPGEVTLTIRRSGATVIIAWPSAATGFALEVTDSFSTSPINWSPVSQNPVPAGEDQTVTVSASVQARFYRLRRP